MSQNECMVLLCAAIIATQVSHEFIVISQDLKASDGAKILFNMYVFQKEIKQAILLMKMKATKDNESN